MTCSGSSDVPSLIHHSYHLEGGGGGGGGDRERERERERGGGKQGMKVGNSHIIMLDM